MASNDSGLTRVILARACGTLFIPQQPWREITRHRTFALFLGPNGGDSPAARTGEKRKESPVDVKDCGRSFTSTRGNGDL